MIIKNSRTFAIKGDRSTIIVPISNYDVDEGFPELLETGEEFEWNCIIKIDDTDHQIILKFVPDTEGTLYLREE